MCTLSDDGRELRCFDLNQAAMTNKMIRDSNERMAEAMKGLTLSESLGMLEEHITEH